MKPFKDKARVDHMFLQGEPYMVDTQSGYRYSMVARCPHDQHNATVAQVERNGKCLSKVVFECTSCLQRFEGSRDDVCIW